MINFLLGFATGIYIGTKYDCSPFINAVGEIISKYMPKSKDQISK